MNKRIIEKIQKCSVYYKFDKTKDEAYFTNNENMYKNMNEDNDIKWIMHCCHAFTTQ